MKTHEGMVRKLDCLYVPELRKNLISLGTLAKNRMRYAGEGDWVKVTEGSLVIMKGKMNHGEIYILEGNMVMGTVAISQSLNEGDDKIELLNRRLGHMSEKGMPILSKKVLHGGEATRKIKFCEACVKVKHRKVNFDTGQHTSKEILDFVHSDLWDPTQVKCQGGCSYFVMFIDDYSRKVWLYFLKTKHEVFGNFKEWKTMVEKRTRKQVKTLRIDNGLEFCNAPFDNFYKAEGILRHHTVRHTPHQNVVAERMNQTLMQYEGACVYFLTYPRNSRLKQLTLHAIW